MLALQHFVRGVVDLFAARRFWLMLMLPSLTFAAVALATPDQIFIIFLNFVLISLSTVICIAYGPEAYRILAGKSLLDEQGSVIVGIFTAWFTVIYLTVLNLFWRYLGQPSWIPNSDLTSFRIFLMCFAASMHIRPHVMRERVPTRRLLNIGIGAAVVVFVTLIVVYSGDLRRMWQSSREPYRAQPISLREGGIYSRPHRLGQADDRPEDFIAGPVPRP